MYLRILYMTYLYQGIKQYPVISLYLVLQTVNLNINLCQYDPKNYCEVIIYINTKRILDENQVRMIQSVVQKPI